MIITVASFKGGVGKTTTAVHLACAYRKLRPALNYLHLQQCSAILQDSSLTPSLTILGIAHAHLLVPLFAFQVSDLAANGTRR